MSCLPARRGKVAPVAACAASQRRTAEKRDRTHRSSIDAQKQKRKAADRVETPRDLRLLTFRCGRPNRIDASTRDVLPGPLSAGAAANGVIIQAYADATRNCQAATVPSTDHGSGAAANGARPFKAAPI